MAETPKMDFTNWDTYKDWQHWTDGQWKQWETSLTREERIFLNDFMERSKADGFKPKSFRDLFDPKTDIKNPYGLYLTPATYFGEIDAKELFDSHEFFDDDIFNRKDYPRISNGKIDAKRPQLETGEKFLGYAAYSHYETPSPRKAPKRVGWEGPLIQLADDSISLGDPRSPGSQAAAEEKVEIFLVDEKNNITGRTLLENYPGKPIKGVADSRIENGTTYILPLTEREKRIASTPLRMAFP
jgi:hypothetical protein